MEGEQTTRDAGSNGTPEPGQPAHAQPAGAASALPPATLTPSDSDLVSAEQAYLRVLPEIEALAPSEVVRPNVDAMAAAARAVGALPRIRTLEAEILAQVPGFQMDTLKRVQAYGMAVVFAYAVRRPRRGTAQLTNALVPEARQLKRELLVTAHALALFDLMPSKLVASIPRQAGHLATAEHLLRLAALFEARWPDVANRVPFARARLERAQEVGTALVKAMGARLQPGAIDAERAASADTLARAFTLFARAYDQCRQVVSFVRWSHGDADRFAPSLFERRSKRRAQETTSPPRGASGHAAPPPDGDAVGSG